MILLLPQYDNQREYYLEFYFSKLRTLESKKHFVQNFKDIYLIDFLNKFTELIICNPFYSSAISQFASEYKLSEKKLTKYQRLFYVDIYKASRSENNNNDIEILYQRLLDCNRSFRFLVSLEKEDVFLRLITFNNKLSETKS